MSQHNPEQHHGHDHDLAHHHDIHAELPSDPALRVKALESLLTEKGLVDPAAIDAWIEIYATVRRWWPGPGSIPPTSSAC